MTVFFDVDDTLYDRGLPFISAAKAFFDVPGMDLRAVYRLCTARGNEVFLPSQRGEITMDEMVIYRWKKGFADAGVALTDEEALAFQKCYAQKQNEITLSPVREAILRVCAAEADGVGVITNGPSEKQWNKVERLGLRRFIASDHIIISGDVGIDKPDEAIFRLAEKRCGKMPGEMWYVGDSLKNDIAPALSCGWHAIWLNCDAIPVPDGLKMDAVAESEEELLSQMKRFLRG